MIYLKNPSEINSIDYVNSLGIEILSMCYEYIKPGIITLELEELLLRFCLKNNVKPAFKGYKGFPHNLCVSVNEEVIHGFPNECVLKDGDVVSVDIGLVKNGYYSDAAFTKIAGNTSKKTLELVRSTYDCLYAGIKNVLVGNRISNIGYAIQSTASRVGFDVVRDFVGHGVGLNLHEPPKIPNYVVPSLVDWKLRTGMVVAIEPILTEGSSKIQIKSNNWTIVTKDGGLAAHFERSVALTQSGLKILGGKSIWD